jgi:hypothetical protein
MKPELRGGPVAAVCPTCKAVTTFENAGGSCEQARRTPIDGGLGASFSRVVWLLLKCAGCGRAGLAEIACSQTVGVGKLLSFVPRAVDPVVLPEGVPEGIVSEFREAEACIASQTWRGASALFRSALEKTLRLNGYVKGSLADRIDAAAADNVITAARARRAHEDVRVLGNEVVHDDWRAVSEEEVEESHHYVQRVIEDLYDDRAEVEKVLKEKGRL